MTKLSLLQIYFGLKGRLPRGRFFTMIIVSSFLFIGVDLLLKKFGIVNPFIQIIINLFFSYIIFAGSAKRINDIGYNGLYYLLLSILQIFIYITNLFHIDGPLFTIVIPNTVSVASAITFLILIIVKGTKGPNKYGDDPISAPTSTPISAPTPTPISAPTPTPTPTPNNIN